MKLTRKEKRELGLTFRQLCRAVKDLKSWGEWPDDVDAQRRALIEYAVEHHPDAWAAKAKDMDWEEFFNALIAFLEKLIPIILKLIEIFSAI